MKGKMVLIYYRVKPSLAEQVPIYGYTICKSREPSIDRYYSLSWKKSSFKNSVSTLIVPHLIMSGRTQTNCTGVYISIIAERGCLVFVYVYILYVNKERAARRPVSG